MDPHQLHNGLLNTHPFPLDALATLAASPRLNNPARTRATRPHPKADNNGPRKDKRAPIANLLNPARTL